MAVGQVVRCCCELLDLQRLLDG
eukprot:COSAG02_NODE_37989_length_435_cov_0.586310_1_plen_22_part_10